MKRSLIVISLISINFVLNSAEQKSIRDLPPEEKIVKTMGTFQNEIPPTLDLSNKGLTSLDGLQEIPAIATVEHLDLSRNRLRTIRADDLRACPGLRKLNLRNNELQELQADTFNRLQNLRELILAKNRLLVLPAEIFNQLGNLEDLNLAHNELSELAEGIFNSLVNLRELNLSHNRIQALRQHIFDHLTHLFRLNLSYNELNELPEKIFSALINLVLLRLEHNRLQILPAHLFDSLGKLNWLDLSNNRLSRLSVDDFIRLTELGILRLSNNRLKTLPEGIFNSLVNLYQLFLGRNNILGTNQNFRQRYIEPIQRRRYLQWILKHPLEERYELINQRIREILTECPFEKENKPRIVESLTKLLEEIVRIKNEYAIDYPSVERFYNLDEKSFEIAPNAAHAVEGGEGGQEEYYHIEENYEENAVPVAPAGGEQALNPEQYEELYGYAPGAGAAQPAEGLGEEGYQYNEENYQEAGAPFADEEGGEEYYYMDIESERLPAAGTTLDPERDREAFEQAKRRLFMLFTEEFGNILDAAIRCRYANIFNLVMQAFPELLTVRDANGRMPFIEIAFNFSPKTALFIYKRAVKLLSNNPDLTPALAELHRLLAGRGSPEALEVLDGLNTMGYLKAAAEEAPTTE